MKSLCNKVVGLRSETLLKLFFNIRNKWVKVTYLRLLVEDLTSICTSIVKKNWLLEYRVRWKLDTILSTFLKRLNKVKHLIFRVNFQVYTSIFFITFNILKKQKEIVQTEKARYNDESMWIIKTLFECIIVNLQSFSYQFFKMMNRKIWDLHFLALLRDCSQILILIFSKFKQIVFYSPSNHKKTNGFLMIFGGMEVN